MSIARSYRKFLFCVILFTIVWIVMIAVGPKFRRGVIPSLELSKWERESSVTGHFSSPDTNDGVVRKQTKPIPAPGPSRNGSSSLPNPVLLCASMRTGSSFVGEILGNGKDVFYLFEPGHALQKTVLANETSSSDTVASLCINMLAKLYRCDFRDLDFYLKYLSGLELKELRHRTPKLYRACRSQQPKEAKDDQQCRVTRRMATKACKKSKYIVVKEIRIPDIQMLTPLIEDHGLDLRVINLVRDPRPMTASHAVAMHGHNILSNKTLPEYSNNLLSNYCRHGKANLELGMRPSWQRRYMFLRYEDMSSDPTSTTKKLFEFLGQRKVPKSVRRWIRKNTKSGTPDLYSTKGNSSQVYQAWRSSMSFEIAKAIEETGQCRQMMDMMGYRLLEDESHQRNLSRSLY